MPQNDAAVVVNVSLSASRQNWVQAPLLHCDTLKHEVPSARFGRQLLPPPPKGSAEQYWPTAQAASDPHDVKHWLAFMQTYAPHEVSLATSHWAVPLQDTAGFHILETQLAALQTKPGL